MAALDWLSPARIYLLRRSDKKIAPRVYFLARVRKFSLVAHEKGESSEVDQRYFRSEDSANIVRLVVANPAEFRAG